MMNALLDLVFPPKCPFCTALLDKEHDTYICESCQTKIAGRNSKISFKGEFFDKGYACFEYSGNIRQSLHRFKFDGRKEYARVYSKYILSTIQEESHLLDADLITSVPTNKANIRKRGYDHAAHLAKAVSGDANIKYLATLEKIRKTGHMFGLKPHERRANILGAIALSCDRELINDKNVIIIDDIYTTGATASECARVLKSNGAKKVYILTVAKSAD